MCITVARKRSSASKANSKSKSMGYATKLIRGRSSWFLVEPFTPSPLGKETHLLAVMSREIAELIDRLHEPMSAADRDALWGRYRSSLA
jgi:hypothetical protein